MQKRNVGRPKGYAKSGGRQKGTPNRRNKIDVYGSLEERGIDLVDEILKSLEECNEPADRLHAYFKLLEYCAPKFRAIDHPIDDDEAPINITPDNVVDLYNIAKEHSRSE